MCYHASLEAEWQTVKARMQREVAASLHMSALPLPFTSAFARPWWPVVSTDAPGSITIKQWGLVPPFGKRDPKAFLSKSPTFNAISEEAASKPSFRKAWSEGRRCLIPITRFKEWQHRPVPGRKTPDKVPYEIRLKGEDIFCVAGLWEDDTYTILTRPANTLMAEIHNSKKRMPVIISRAYEGDWLQPGLTSEDVLRFCMGVEEHDLEAIEEIKPEP